MDSRENLIIDHLIDHVVSKRFEDSTHIILECDDGSIYRAPYPCDDPNDVEQICGPRKEAITEPYVTSAKIIKIDAGEDHTINVTWSDGREYAVKLPTDNAKHKNDPRPKTIQELTKELRDVTGKKYPVITLCGSTKFKEAFMHVQKELTLAGNIVISIGAFGHSGDYVVFGENNKVMLDEMQLEKINMSDAIFVIDKDNRIGTRTYDEIRYATCNYKFIYFYTDIYHDDDVNRGRVVTLI